MNKAPRKIIKNIKEILQEIKLRKDEKLWYVMVIACVMMILGFNAQQDTISSLRAELKQCREQN